MTYLGKWIIGTSKISRNFFYKIHLTNEQCEYVREKQNQLKSYCYRKGREGISIITVRLERKGDRGEARSVRFGSERLLGSFQ